MIKANPFSALSNVLSYFFLHYSQGPESAELTARLHEVFQELEAIESDKAPARASVILAGLGFPPESQKRATR